LAAVRPRQSFAIQISRFQRPIEKLCFCLIGHTDVYWSYIWFRAVRDGELKPSCFCKADRELGSKVFREALCARCHRVGREGQAVGPDLTFVGRRFSPRDLLESILTPSRSVAENFRTDVIVTQSGDVHVGRILIEGDYRSQRVRIQTDPLKSNSVVEIDKKEIEEHKQLDRSPMPDSLLDTFNRDEIRALLAFLQSPT
jgi:putative heme-binding domain-containing protein